MRSRSEATEAESTLLLLLLLLLPLPLSLPSPSEELELQAEMAAVVSRPPPRVACSDITVPFCRSLAFPEEAEGNRLLHSDFEGGFDAADCDATWPDAARDLRRCLHFLISPTPDCPARRADLRQRVNLCQASSLSPKRLQQSPSLCARE